MTCYKCLAKRASLKASNGKICKPQLTQGKHMSSQWRRWAFCELSVYPHKKFAMFIAMAWHKWPKKLVHEKGYTNRDDNEWLTSDVELEREDCISI